MNSQSEKIAKGQIIKRTNKLILLKNLFFSKFIMAGFLVASFSISYLYLKWQLVDYLKHSQDNIENELKELKVIIDKNYKRNRNLISS
jgi:type III secretory pathway component EscU